MMFHVMLVQVRDALKKQLAQLLPQCIQAPPAVSATVPGSPRPRKATKPVNPTAAVAAAAAGAVPLHEVSSEHSQFSQVAGAVRREAGEDHFTLESDDGESAASASAPGSPGAAKQAPAQAAAEVPPADDQGGAEEAQQGRWERSMQRATSYLLPSRPFRPCVLRVPLALVPDLLSVYLSPNLGNPGWSPVCHELVPTCPSCGCQVTMTLPRRWWLSWLPGLRWWPASRRGCSSSGRRACLAF
jgi:hypothetical protein